MLTQLFLAGSIALMSRINPAEQTYLFAGLALLVFFSSSQDIVIDAYRTDISPSEERGLAASVGVFGYRLAMIVSVVLPLFWRTASAGRRSISIWL